MIVEIPQLIRCFFSTKRESFRRQRKPRCADPPAVWLVDRPGGRGRRGLPAPAPDGAPRVAANSDAPLLTDWFAAFVDEVHDPDAGEGLFHALVTSR
jgi:hypothetical protein